MQAKLFRPLISINTTTAWQNAVLQGHTLRRTHSMTPADYTVLIKRTEVENFCCQCLEHVGAKPAHAKALAQVLAEADFRGHYSHGFNRLEMYVRDIEQKICSPDADPKIVTEAESAALVDGANVLGPVVGNFCMELAIAKAKKTGIALVCANNSNHYGIAGWYAMQASKQGMIGMSFTNTSPFVYPNRGRKAAVGTNPLAFAAPASDTANDFVLDMATSAVAVGKLEMCRRKGNPIPAGWAADSDGKITDDPNVGMNGGLLPLGGDELTSGYKGFGLGMMVEVLCGILAGAQWGPHIRRWMDTTRVADLGQAFMAIDPDKFAPGFKGRMNEYVETMRAIPPANNSNPVIVAGDPERGHIAEVLSEGGIRYPPVLIQSLDQLADRIGVDRVNCLKGHYY